MRPLCRPAHFSPPSPRLRGPSLNGVGLLKIKKREREREKKSKKKKISRKCDLTHRERGQRGEAEESSSIGPRPGTPRPADDGRGGLSLARGPSPPGPRGADTKVRARPRRPAGEHVRRGGHRENTGAEVVRVKVDRALVARHGGAGAAEGDEHKVLSNVLQG